jgi:hypoxanthine phosphoribosyltransferase
MSTMPAVQVMFEPDAVQNRVTELAHKIQADYDPANPPVLVGVLKGCLYFLADLSRQIDLLVEIDTMCISSYGSGTEHSGTVRILKDLDGDIAGRHVLIVEDIVDTGLTLDHLMRVLSTRSPESLRVCALLDKASRRQVDVQVDYIGFSVPDRFVVGYGLDYDQRFRNLPYIGVLDPSHHQNV